MACLHKFKWRQFKYHSEMQSLKHIIWEFRMRQYDHIYAAICVIIKLKVMFWKLYNRIYFNVETFKVGIKATLILNSRLCGSLRLPRAVVHSAMHLQFTSRLDRGGFTESKLQLQITTNYRVWPRSYTTGLEIGTVRSSEMTNILGSTSLVSLSLSYRQPEECPCLTIIRKDK